MDRVLVTGASSFLGYHVAKRLNEQGIRPRVLELKGARRDPLQNLNVEQSAGDLEDAQSLTAACTGVDTLLHLAFKVIVGGGPAELEEMERVNIAGSNRLLEAAAAKGVGQVVVVSSALAVGVNRQPQPLDETANWTEHAFNFPYARLRRRAELEALARARPGFSVVAVCPSFTFGPDDPVGAPANGLLKTLINRKLRFTLPVGFGALDVRDFANGTILAAERGRSGQRYLISGHNVMATELLEQAAAIAGVGVPRFVPPRVLLHTIVGAVEIFSKLRRKPSPITRDVLQIFGRYAWYDTSRAQAELGWAPRPLKQTLEDTIRWLRSSAPKT